MIDCGSGTPVVLIPGLQGRWEWMRPAVDALARRCRVLTFSLRDEPSSGFAAERSAGMAGYVRQIEEAMERASVHKAVVIGVSYGGLIATEFAARQPERVLGLVLVSALPPGWTPDRRARFYMRAPWLFSPIFCLASPARMLPEILAALDLRARLRFIAQSIALALRARLSPARMARRIAWLESYAFADPAAVHAPALIITGEDRLDRIVTPELTRQYIARLPRAHAATLARTGHLGLITRPAEFAELVWRFTDGIAGDARRIPA